MSDDTQKSEFPAMIYIDMDVWLEVKGGLDLLRDSMRRISEYPPSAGSMLVVRELALEALARTEERKK